MKNKKQVKIAVFVIVILLAMGGLGGFFYYRSAAYAYRNFIRELHRLDTEKIVHRIEIQDRPLPWIGIHVYLKNHMFPKSKKIPMKDLAELTERYREACDRLLTKENPNCRGNIGLIHLYFEPSSYMTGRSSTIFELRRAIERDEKTGEKKDFDGLNQLTISMNTWTCSLKTGPPIRSKAFAGKSEEWKKKSAACSMKSRPLQEASGRRRSNIMHRVYR